MLTSAEVLKAVGVVFPKSQVTLESVDNGCVTVQVSTNTSGERLTYTALVALSQMLGTLTIDVDGYATSGGCDTCDFESDRGFILSVRW